MVNLDEKRRDAQLLQTLGSIAESLRVLADAQAIRATRPSNQAYGPGRPVKASLTAYLERRAEQIKEGK